MIINDSPTNLIKLHNKKYKHISSSRFQPKKVIVFDLDETIGSFSDLAILCNYLEKLNYIITIKSPIKITQPLFNELLEMYPEFIRYGMLIIFEYLKYKKKMGECYKIFIYTNNQHSKTWTTYITNYIDFKLNTVNLIDQIISAFKINNKIVEPLRTTMKKTYEDFIKCSLLSKKVELAFIDDTYYDKMNNDQIYYIQPLPYYHYLTNSEIISRFMNISVFHNITEMEKEIIQKELRNVFSIRNNITYEEFLINNKMNLVYNNVYISKKIMYYVKDFFYLTKRKVKTKKHKPIQKLNRFTHKNYKV